MMSADNVERKLIIKFGPNSFHMETAYQKSIFLPHKQRLMHGQRRNGIPLVNHS